MMSDFDYRLGNALYSAFFQIKREDAAELPLAIMGLDEAEIMEAYFGSDFGQLLARKRKQEEGGVDNTMTMREYYKRLARLFNNIAEGRVPILFNQMPYRTRKSVSAFPNVELTGSRISNLGECWGER